jgi:hypothetical protein
MNAKRTYIALCILGFALPYYFFVRFIPEHGLRLSVLAGLLFANPISSFFAADVIVSSVVLWVFMSRDSQTIDQTLVGLYPR